MDHICERSWMLEGRDADRWQRLKLSSLFLIFQELAGRQCEDFHCGTKELMPKGIFWAVARMALEVNRMPTIGEHLTAQTWPGQPHKLLFPRYYQLLDEQGNILIRGCGIWLLMDYQTRAMVKPEEYGITVPSLMRANQLPLPRSMADIELPSYQERTVRFTETDFNGHMNNAKYLDWMDDLLGGSFHRAHCLKSLQINYITEAKEGEKVRLDYAMEDSYLRIEAHSGSSRVFSIHACFAPNVQEEMKSGD